MSEQEEGPPKTSYSAPNLFYDAIVFLTPTITLLAGVLVGIRHLFLPYLKSEMKLDTGTTAVLAVILFFMSYEFGRLAETYSDVFVGSPLRAFHKKGLLFKSKDFALDLSDQVLILGIPEELFFGRTRSKWTLFFFALEYVPLVGADLLKRYAWEKLARSSSFCGFILAIASFAVMGWDNAHSWTAPQMTFGSWSYTCAAALLYLISAIDYYKRNCWNNDLLITTMPVILSGVQKTLSASTERKAEPDLHPTSSRRHHH